MGGTHVLREATVYEARSDWRAGRADITRRGHVEARRAGRGDRLVAQDSDRAPVEPQLDLVIDDGNNPPSDVRSITAVFAELPWIYFESTGDAVVARYGNAVAEGAAVRPRGRAPDARHRTTRWTRRGVKRALRRRGGERQPCGAGAADRRLGARSGDLPISCGRSRPGAAGLVTIPLDAPVLAHSQGAALRRRARARRGEPPGAVSRRARERAAVARSDDRAGGDASGVAAVGSNGQRLSRAPAARRAAAGACWS